VTEKIEFFSQKISRAVKKYCITVCQTIGNLYYSQHVANIFYK